MYAIDIGRPHGRIGGWGPDGRPAVTTVPLDPALAADPAAALAALLAAARESPDRADSGAGDTAVALALPVGDGGDPEDGAGEREQALRRAAEQAGLRVAHVVPEAVAAALHYGAVVEGVDRTVLVCDQGAGTLDLTVLDIAPHRTVHVAATRRLPVPEGDWDGGTVAAVTGFCADAPRHPDAVLLAGELPGAPGTADRLETALGLPVRCHEPELAVVYGLLALFDFGALRVRYGQDGSRAPRLHAPEPLPRHHVEDPEPPAAYRYEDPEPPAAPVAPEPPAPPVRAPEAARAPVPGPLPEPPLDTEPPREPGPHPVSEPGLDPGSEAVAEPGFGPAPPSASEPPPAAAPAGAEGPVRNEPPAEPWRDAGPGPEGSAETAGGAPGALVAVPVEELQALRRGAHLLVLWAWPPGARTARVRWRVEGETSARGPLSGDVRCGRREYEHDGGLDLTVGRGAVTLTVEALVADRGVDCEGASSLLIDAEPPVVEYEPSVRRRLKGRIATVTFTSETACELPALRIVHGVGRYRPTRMSDGAVLHEVPAQRLTARQPLAVEFPFPATRDTSWLVCFPADADAAADQGVDVRPTALHRLRVT
ncbi:Hsp70 family protein [Streptomyces sp. NPDC008121]|uniref:Hsp70 family protein n=1 Tax=Streptomyces sp. NPDC008121 TaxID=3364809 RepID=UPI0036EDAC30